MITEFPYYPGTKAVVYNGDCLDILRQIPDNSVDAVVTDPPYGLSAQPDMAEVMQHWLSGDDYVHRGAGFMGKSWDSFVPGPSVWRECFRVLKPGGHLLSFAGSRTQDLMGLSIRLAGFEIRDSIAWLYGSGFPKSLDVSKAVDKAAGAERTVVGLAAGSANRSAVSFQAHDRPTGYNANPEGDRLLTAPATEAAQQWQGWGTALKPAFEPIVVGRKPLVGTVAANVLEHGTGALNIDGCRTEGAANLSKWGGKQRTGVGYSDEGRAETGWKAASGHQTEPSEIPCRVHGIKRCTICAPSVGRWPTNVVLDESQAAELDAQTGVLKSGGFSGTVQAARTDQTSKGNESVRVRADRVADSGGASRFFPVFKYQAKAPGKERPKVDGISHATVKPLELMRWLVRLVTPPDGVVLEPFAGSGTTVEAALLEGFHCVAIEREAEYLPLVFHRIQRATQALREDVS